MCQSLFIRCLLCGVEVAAEGIATRADGLGLGAASLENPDGYSAVSSWTEEWDCIRVIYVPAWTLSLQINLAPGQQPEHVCWAGGLPWRTTRMEIENRWRPVWSLVGEKPPPTTTITITLFYSRSSSPDPGEPRAGRAWFPKLSSYFVFFQGHIDKPCELGQINLSEAFVSSL